MKPAARAAVIAMVLLTTFVWLARPWLGRASIQIDPSVRYQTLAGWEATAQAGHYDCPGFPDYREELFDRAVGELGIDRLRLELRSGVENPVDWFARRLEGRTAPGEWKSHWYEIVNDDADPARAAAGRFQFSELDHAVEQVALPLRERLARRGESLYTVVTYVDFETTSDLHRANPAEYAELVVATYRHLSDRFGFTPDAWEVVLEPDNSAWTGVEMGRAIVESAARLREAGFEPRFIAPSTTAMSEALPYFEAIASVPGAVEWLIELSYHRYGGVSRATLEAIAATASRTGLRTAMLERIRADHDDLHDDLVLGNASAWQQYALCFCFGDDGAAYFYTEKEARGPGILALSQRAKLLRPYFRFARRGDTRIHAESSDENLAPVAFQGPDGRVTVVVKASGGGRLEPAGGRFALEGLPPGDYRLSYTTASEYVPDAGRVAVAAGEPLEAELADAGVMAIAALPTPPPAR